MLFPGPTTFPGPETFTGASAQDAGTVTPPPSTDGLAELFELDAVQAELDGRTPRLLSAQAPYPARLTHIVRGVAAEVTQLCESVPPAGWVRDLAVAAMHLGVASRVESSAYPEQQGMGDQGRSQLLQARYLGVRAQLLQAVSDGGADGVPSAGAAGGGFRTPGSWTDSATRSPLGLTVPGVLYSADGSRYY